MYTLAACALPVDIKLLAALVSMPIYSGVTTAVSLHVLDVHTRAYTCIRITALPVALFSMLFPPALFHCTLHTHYSTPRGSF